jgi:hypothetical protein
MQNLPFKGACYLKDPNCIYVFIHYFQYNLLGLKEKCAKSLESNMTVKNITAILNVADLHNCSELKEKAIALIGR